MELRATRSPKEVEGNGFMRFGCDRKPAMPARALGRVHPCYALAMSPITQSWVQLAVIVFGIGAALVGPVAYQTHYIDERSED